MDMPNRTESDDGGGQSDLLAPVRRLVLLAFVFTLVGVGVLAMTAVHVMETTNHQALTDERVRAARIADAIDAQPAHAVAAMVEELGRVAGLRDLQLSEAGPTDTGRAVLPLVNGVLGGQTLSWLPETPGQVLLERYAPTRLPLAAGMILAVLTCLLICMGVVRRIEHRRKLAEVQATHDHLTGLPNRLALERQLDRYLRGGRAFSVIAMDLDRFKPVNDLFGHEAGDLALCEVSRRLKRLLRPGEFLARIGGDEFVAIVERAGGHMALSELAGDINAVVCEPVTIGGRSVQLGVSLGIVADARGAESSDVVRLADRALYDAKRLAGGAFCFAEPIASAAA